MTVGGGGTLTINVIVDGLAESIEKRKIVLLIFGHPLTLDCLEMPVLDQVVNPAQKVSLHQVVGVEDHRVVVSAVELPERLIQCLHFGALLEMHFYHFDAYFCQCCERGRLKLVGHYNDVIAFLRIELQDCAARAGDDHCILFIGRDEHTETRVP